MSPSLIWTPLVFRLVTYQGLISSWIHVIPSNTELLFLCGLYLTHPQASTTENRRWDQATTSSLSSLRVSGFIQDMACLLILFSQRYTVAPVIMSLLRTINFYSADYSCFNEWGTSRGMFAQLWAHDGSWVRSHHHIFKTGNMAIKMCLIECSVCHGQNAAWAGKKIKEWDKQTRSSEQCE